jgi:tetratricopeptide (TPR) repeat protein
MTKKLFILPALMGVLLWASCGGEKAAEITEKAEKDAEGENIPGMYASLGRLNLSQGDYPKALEYADKALDVDKENTSYRLLKGHVLIALNEYTGALEIFDRLFTKDANYLEEPGVEDLRAYLLLLAQAERPGEAAAILERYFETGAYFPGLGYLAAAIYRAAGETEKAGFAALLEGEYRSGYGALEDVPLGDAFTAGFTPAKGPPAETDFFVREYLYCKELIGNNSISEFQFRRYVELEPYFRLFPSYYWNFWQGACFLYPGTYQNFTPVLQKIITLDREGPFAKEAWEELTRLMGY